MAKMWAGRTDGVTDQIADDFNSSIHFDSRMYRQDITGSMAHAAMLAARNIITAEEADTLIAGLEGVLADIESGALPIDMTCEDIHMFVEQVLTERLGDVGKKLHTARSRNDQVALDIRMYLRDEITEIIALVRDLIEALADQAEANASTIMPGYTHLQRAQPITFGHHLMAYAMMLLRDIDRLQDCKRRMNISPIGSCALAGTTYDTDRRFEAAKLGFDGICLNSLDGVSDRDFAVEFMSACALMMMHLSRFSEEIILWSSWEFKFVELSDAYTTGSSIMPQKKNPDMAELIRGKTGRVYGDLVALLTTLKGIPLAYNKDMQEDKERIFDCVDTVKMCLAVAAPMVATMKAIPENMMKAAQGGFINATDLADYLVKKGLPFRSAYKISGQIVAHCIQNREVLETLPLETYRTFSDLFDTDLYDEISLTTCVEKRISEGGTSVGSVKAQIAYVRAQNLVSSDEKSSRELPHAEYLEMPIILQFADQEDTTMIPVYESIEWDNTWMEQTENTVARRILYVGDSISVGTRSVANPMGAGKVVFDNFGSSKSLDNPVFFESLSLFASQQPSRAAVFFNNGLHGWHLTDEEYETLYAVMLDKLIEAYGDVPVIPLLSTFTTSPYSPVERVQARNAIVSRLAAARGLRVIDLYSVSKANADRLTDGVHFDIEGYNALAEELLRVAETL